MILRKLLYEYLACSSKTMVRLYEGKAQSGILSISVTEELSIMFD